MVVYILALIIKISAEVVILNSRQLMNKVQVFVQKMHKCLVNSVQMLLISEKMN